LNYKIAIKKSVIRDLKKIDGPNRDRILIKIENELPAKAETFPVLTGQFSGLRKFRIGDYRVIYTILEKTVLILRVRHRKDAYR
jgi:addiction module RelE/StbE family toxin